jgi:quinol monooxygenase YgiN
MIFLLSLKREEGVKMEAHDPRPWVYQVLNSVKPRVKLVTTVGFKVDKKREKRFLELVNGFVVENRRAPGVIHFDLHSLLPPSEDRGEYLLYEEFEDRDCVKGHWESDSLRIFQGKLQGEELITSLPDLRFYARSL